MPKKIETPKQKKQKQFKYSVVLSFGDIGCGAGGDTIENALEQLKPSVIKSTGTLSVEYETKRAEILLRPFQVKRMLVNKIYRIILDKRLNTLLK